MDAPIVNQVGPRSLAKNSEVSNIDLQRADAVLHVRCASVILDLGQIEEAVAAAWEAVALYRDLARARPKVSAPVRARSLGDLAIFLSALDLHEEALATRTEAAEIR